MRRTLICLAGLAALAFATASQAADKKAPEKTPGKELKIVSDIEKRVAKVGRRRGQPRMPGGGDRPSHELRGDGHVSSPEQPRQAVRRRVG